MGDRLKHLRNAAGYSLLEVMVGGLLLGLIALALLPAFFALNNSLKISAFQTSCNSIVRAKLQDYVNGVNLPAATGYTGVPSGFEYTKYRYYKYAGLSETANGHTYYHCQQNPAANLTGVAATSWYYPGYRENINNNDVINYNAGDDPANPDVPERLQGFQLYVNVRHYNPRYVGTTGTDLQPRRQCPAGSTYTTPEKYQFLRLGDALEVVVTGMIRTNPAKSAGGRGGAAWGPFKDLNDDTPNPRLVCSATQVIYPPRVPFRYYLGVDGKIRNFQNNNISILGVPDVSTEATEAHFRNIWSQAPVTGASITSPGNVNIRSFAVSPENNRVYVLRPGELKLYYDCSDQASTTVDAKTYELLPDCNLGTNKIITWAVDSNIDSITVNFKDVTNSPTAIQNDKIYAILNTGGNALGEIKLLTVPAADGIATTGDTGASSTFVVPGSAAIGERPRIQGIFLGQSFPAVNEPNLFYFDNTCPTMSSGAIGTYCVSIFNSADPNMAMPIRDMPVQTEAISY